MCDYTYGQSLRLIRKDMKRKQDRISVREGELPVLSFPLLDEQKWLINGFSTRLGGVSRGNIGTLNFSFERDTCSENVVENFERMARALGVDESRIVFSWQTHTTNIRKVKEEDAGKGLYKDRDYRDIDGLITNVPGMTLVTFYADCVPLLVADPVHHAIGAAHSGWRGTVASIGGELIRSMQEEYGTNPEDVIACIGPSICQDCYEVSEDVAQQFQAAYDPGLHDRLMYAKGNGKYQLDLHEACRQNFLAAGVLYENISVPDLCTCCNPDVLFSHRASKGDRGLLAAFMCVKPSDDEI